MRTRFTDLIGCDLPLQLASMSGMVTPELAAVVSNAGGLGMLAVGRHPYEQMAPQIDRVLELTDGPVGAGFIVEFLDLDTVRAVAERLPVLEFFWGWPDRAVVEACGGRLVGWQVGSVDEAVAAADAGCHYVTVQGVEAGGHVRTESELLELVPAVRSALPEIPLLAAGGIATAADVVTALEHGADGVRVGTRFVATDESAAHDRYVELLVEADDTSTELSEAFWVGWPDALHRVLTSCVEASGDGADVVGEMPGPDGERHIVPRFFVSAPTRDFSGNIDAMALYAGLHLTPITGRVPAAQVVADLMAGIE